MTSKIRLLLLSMLGVLVFSLPAQAARLLQWQFNAGQNRLEFTTDSQVRPRAQLIFNPTRIVIDLPGTRLGRPKVQTPVGGGIRSYRVGQFDQQTTRIVIELESGYTIDPNKVVVRGLSQTRWAVELPQPQRQSASNSSPTSNQASKPLVAQPSRSDASSAQAASPKVVAPTYVTEVRKTPDGLFIRTTGDKPEVEVKRSRDRKAIEIELPKSALGKGLIPVPPAVPELGIQQMILSQKSEDPAVVQLRLVVPSDAPDWQATVSNLGGIVLLPKERPTPTQANAASQGQSPTVSTTVPTLEGVAIDRGRNQLLIQVDQPVRYSSRAEGNEYVLTLSPAKLGSKVREPRVYVGDRVRRVTVKQQGPQSVQIRLIPSRGVSIGEIQATNLKLLSLPLRRDNAIAVQPPAVRPPNGAASGSSGIRPTIQPLPGAADIDLPVINRRALVVIDPGHGGRDPGAVGNGLRETDIVLDISRQVTAYLQQSGVEVVMTRNSEFELDLPPRVNIARRANATLFVSIHANAISMSRPDVNGVETYYYSGGGKALAQDIQNSILQSVRIGNRGVKQARFYVLRRTSMPAALVETGFITGAEDHIKLADPEFRTRMARAIARGILRHLR